jgi:hypothetical protein
MRHEQVQTDAALGESAQARVSTAVQMATADPSPERLENSRREITEAVNIVGKMAGLPPEAIQAKLNESMTMMHSGVVMRLLDSEKTDDAKAYYYTHKKEIDGGTQLTIEKALERDGRLQKTQEAADGIMLKFGDLGSAMEHVEKAYAGEDEKLIKAEVQSRFTTRQAASNAMSQKAYESSVLAVAEGRKVPASLWTQMDDGHKAAIIDRQRAEAKRRETEAAGGSVKTVFTEWDKLNRMVTDDPKAFAALDLERYSDKVSRQDLMEFAGVQRKIRSGDDKPIKDAATLAQQIDVVQDQLKIKPNTPQSATLRKAVNDAVNVEQQQKDKVLTYEERQKVIDRTVMEFAVPGTLWDSTKRAYEMTPEEKAKAKPKISPADRSAIEAKLRAAGRPADEAAVMEWYRRWKGL